MEVKSILFHVLTFFSKISRGFLREVQEPEWGWMTCRHGLRLEASFLCGIRTSLLQCSYTPDLMVRFTAFNWIEVEFHHKLTLQYSSVCLS
jgi:hypothetical protein